MLICVFVKKRFSAITEFYKPFYCPQMLKKLSADSIENKEAVWFGCDVGKHSSWKKIGLEDLDMYDYQLVFGADMQVVGLVQVVIFVLVYPLPLLHLPMKTSIPSII